MAAYFLDSSAIVKRYLNEIGSSWVINIADSVKRNTLYVARIAGVEVISALKRQEQQGNLSLSGASAVLAQFRLDFAGQYRIIAITLALLNQAMSFAETHALRV